MGLIKNSDSLIGVCIQKQNNMRKSRSTVISVSIITFEWRYVEYEFMVKGESLTKTVSDRLTSVFKDYAFTKNTIVVFSDNILKSEPIYVYLKILSSQLKFKLLVKSPKSMITRILGIYKSYFGKYNKQTQTYRKRDGNMHWLQPLWNKLIQLKKCPWINEHYN